MDVLQIRPVTSEDIPLLLAMIRELASYEKMSDLVTADETILADELFIRRRAEAVLLWQGQQPVGYALFFHNFSTFLGRAGIYIEDIYVRPAYRSQGYGKSVFRYLAQLAQDRKCGRIEWCCLDWNAPSLAFYKSLGAVPLKDWMLFRLSGEQIMHLAEAE